MRALRRGIVLGSALALAACSSSNPYQGMDADQLYRLAFDEYQKGEYEHAADALQRLLNSFGAWDRVPDARLLLAHSYYQNHEYLTARSEYSRFLDRYPGNPQAPVAGLGMCRSLVALSPKSQRDQSYTRDAVTRCRTVLLDYPGTAESREAGQLADSMRTKLAKKEYETGSFYSKRKLWDSAIQYYQFVVDLYPETRYAPMALLGIYRANLAVEYDDLAEDARQRLLNEYPDSPAAAEVRTNGGDP